ncbi:hypothetical protein N431DRAFT_347981 [Stipitochalara longipes BDJ]|nr:hypothetical protein N431DRAFT_347981 [Stipitochalara longipes BDJ]
MTNPSSNANPIPTDPVSSGQSPLIFIDEQERKHNPSSHLRTIVRSNARRSTFLKRQLDQTRIFSSPYCRIIKPEVVVTNKLEVTDPLEAETSPSSSQHFVKLSPYQRGQQRPSRKRHNTELNLQVYKYLKSQTQQLPQKKRGSGEEDQGRPLVSPRTILGEGRVDPFDIYPIKMQPYMHYLVDHYASVCAWGMPKTPNAGFTYIHTKWVPLCMDNQMPFKSMLLAGETSLRGHQGLDPWSLCALSLVSDCVTLLNNELNKPEPKVSDVMFATVVNIAAIELIWGNRSNYDNHLRGLKEIVRIRGGLDDPGISSYVRINIIWLNQLGLDNSLPVSDDQCMLMPPMEQVILSNTSSNCSSSVSHELINILKSICSLTITKVVPYLKHTPISGEFRARCSDIQHQLQSLPSKTDLSNLGSSCMFAAFVYVDLILLHTHSTVVTQSEVARQLHHTIMQWRSAREMNENGELWNWISATASATFGVNNRQKAALVEKFNIAVMGLEHRRNYDER